MEEHLDIIQLLDRSEGQPLAGQQLQFLQETNQVSIKPKHCLKVLYLP
jgi:hypothetical protein